MRNVLLVRYGEVFLKGANRPHFLKILVDNVKKAVKDIGGHVWMSDSRIYVSDVEDMDECVRRVRKVFGLYSVSPAIECEKDLEEIAGHCIFEIDYELFRNGLIQIILGEKLFSQFRLKLGELGTEWRTRNKFHEKECDCGQNKNCESTGHQTLENIFKHLLFLLNNYAISCIFNYYS